MSKKRFLSIILSGVMLLSLACSALAVEQSGRYPIDGVDVKSLA